LTGPEACPQNPGMKGPTRRAATVLAGAWLLGVVVLAGHSGQDRRAHADRVDFNTRIRPLLSDRCFRCHGPDAAKRQAELRLDKREGALKALDDEWAVVKPGDPDRSELVRRIHSFLDDELMPPPDSHLALSDDEKALLTRWVAEGAEYRPHWSFERIESPPVPAADDAAHPVDAFVRARLAREGLRPARRADPETLVRRLAFNLTGLPPTISEIDAFLADPSPAGYARAVEHYLASDAYGERMALDWMDLARYADTYGYQNDVERDMSPWRDWVIRAFARNLPYDQFLTWQLAGDLLPDATRDQRIATAFNRLHRQTNEGGSIEEEFRTEYVADRVHTFGTAMLGLTLECARCHDHKFDPITQRDYYSLFAFFNNIDESGLYSHFTNATPTPSLLLWPAHEQAEHRAVVARIAAAEARLAAVADEARPAFRAWLPAAQLVQPAPIAHLDFEIVDGESTPDRVTGTAAKLQDGPRVVSRTNAGQPGRGAFQFSGDNAVVHPGVPEFVRTDAFSLALRLMPTERQERAVVLHQSRAWTDAGSRGYELTLEHGRPFFGLVHFWPGNAIGVRARRELPLDEWSSLVVTYDGSSRAAGIRLFLNGRPLDTEVVRDRLHKDISYDPEAGDRSSPTHPLTIGARFRDSGFRNGLVDDLQVFDRALTAAEVAGSLARDERDGAVLEHFLARYHAPYIAVADELAALRREENRLVARVPEIMVMEEMPEPRPAHLLARGAYDAPGEVVPRETPASLPPFPQGQPRDRLGLAGWVTDRDNPLTARVAVNRIWRVHFGRGLVPTLDDFGSQGRLPSHPDLLDWLAARFIEDGWDVKGLHRLIVMSETFQQSSQAPPDLLSRDPDNLLLARGPRVRLLAEQVRDGALAASGLLVRTIGGPSVKPYQPPGLWEQAGTGKKYVQDTGDKLYRRSLYTFWRRTSPPPSMLTFDAMAREVCAVRGEPTTTPLQSLVLLNDPQFVEAARVLAEGLLKRHPDDGDARNREAFRTLVGRYPDATELAILRRTFDEQRVLFAREPGSAVGLLGVGESLRDEMLPPADLAAMTTVASLIMNFDEFIVLR
jgi:hypothetical protein